MKFAKIMLFGLCITMLLFPVGCSSPSVSSVPELPSSSEPMSEYLSDTQSNLSDVQSDIQSDIQDGIGDLPEDPVTTEGAEDLPPGDVLSDSDPSSSETANLPASTSMVDVAVNDQILLNTPNTLVRWGQGRAVDDANRPKGCLIFRDKYEKYDAVFLGEDSKTIYLTFDEGFETGYTEKILDTLNAKDAKATFFITMTYVRKNPAIIQRMIDEGHTIGNHTANHPSMPKISIEKCQNEIQSLHQELLKKFGYSISCIRPPQGEFSERTLLLSQQMGYRTIFWSFAYVDWQADQQPNPTAALTRMQNAVHDGAIYLLHVQSTNATVLDAFIDNARAKGYSFATV